MALTQAERDDPAVVKSTFAGIDWYFLLALDSFELARTRHGYDEKAESEETDQTRMLRTLWVANLLDNPDMTFEAFEQVFRRYPFTKLFVIVQALQNGMPGAEGNGRAGDPKSRATTSAASS